MTTDELPESEKFYLYNQKIEGLDLFGSPVHSRRRYTATRDYGPVLHVMTPKKVFGFTVGYRSSISRRLKHNPDNHYGGQIGSMDRVTEEILRINEKHLASLRWKQIELQKIEEQERQRQKKLTGFYNLEEKNDE